MGAPAAGPRVAVLGTGLIGGSILLRLAGTGTDVVAWDPDAGTRAAGARDGLRFAESLAEAVRDRDLVFLGGPLVTLPDTLAEVVEHAPAECTLTDVGSTKLGVSAFAAAIGQTARFVPGHPMAGTERAGLSAADPGLLRGAPWVLSPDRATPLHRWRAVAALLTGVFEARVVPMPVGLHDDVVALSSHLPHVLAGALTAAVARSPVRDGVLALAAGSFRDGTRVAGAPSVRTADMVMQNRAAVLAQFRLVQQSLTELITGLERDDHAELVGRFEAGHRLRTELQSRELRPAEFRFDPSADPSAEYDFLLSTGSTGGHLTRCTADASTVLYEAHLPV